MIVGRTVLTEPHAVDETGEAAMTLSGREAWPIITRGAVLARHEAVLGLRGALVAVRFGQKCERDGYYMVVSSSSNLTDLAGYSGWADWSLSLLRHGPDNVVDLESRLTGAVRANDFSLSGERWHAPAIGAYGYYTGSTTPSTVTRTGEDGPIIVYRQVPAGVSPRWGCAVADYLRGRVRIRTGYPPRELTGLTAAVDADQWELSNGLVRARRSYTAGSIEVGSYTGGWKPKVWHIDIGSGPITSWESATILRNDPEAATLRLTESRAPGRVAVDLTVRRGSRTVEVYVQRGDSGTISVYLASAETMIDNASYVVRSTNDGDGNRAIAGSARNFDPHVNGGITRTSTTVLDCWLGVVAGGGSAVSGDQAAHLRDQYIGALPEVVAAVRR
ncbi:hypothetical protein DP939_02635 [Spongiactinospora rosea]|uniref:Uncharacterized protein n=1 Tax=Spongiactinospora rosea TaxID=2248750 RepID=A0A366M5Z4_9ACTN|nr:hypothetical protein [Spongiactinospora rosea]RBQ21626.1 hypothetical protein DP939_02635 [Spongiactinospora rosea]